MAMEIKTDAEFRKIIDDLPADRLAVIYFYTLWAEPCKQISSVFASLAEVHKDATFISANADEVPEVSESFDVSAVPYFVLLKNATITKEVSGADARELAKSIEQALGKKITTSASNLESDGVGPTAVSAGFEGDKEEGVGSEKPQETEEQLNERLKKLVNAAPVMLFMKGVPSAPQCGFSRQLVAILREHHVRFGFFDILKDDAVRQGLKKFSDWPTFPQLYIKGELQGGLDIIKESLAEDPNFFESALT